MLSLLDRDVVSALSTNSFHPIVLVYLREYQVNLLM